MCCQDPFFLREKGRNMRIHVLCGTKEWIFNIFYETNRNKKQNFNFYLENTLELLSLQLIKNLYLKTNEF